MQGPLGYKYKAQSGLTFPPRAFYQIITMSGFRARLDFSGEFSNVLYFSEQRGISQQIKQKASKKTRAAESATVKAVTQVRNKDARDRSGAFFD